MSRRALSADNFPCAFDPMDSDTYENIDPYIDVNADESQFMHTMNMANRFVTSSQVTDNEEETYSEYPEPSTKIDESEESIHITDLGSSREMLATLTNFSGGQIGQHLKKFKGLIILPLHSISVFRMPHGRHVGNFKMIIFLPDPKKEYPHLENFNIAVNAIYE